MFVKHSPDGVGRSLPGLVKITPTLVGAVVLLVAFVLSVTIWGLVAHGLLRLTGPVHATIGRTYQALFYSSACNFIVAIPLCGLIIFPVSMIWWSVVAGLMLATLQRVHIGGNQSDSQGQGGENAVSSASHVRLLDVRLAVQLPNHQQNNPPRSSG